MTAQEAKSATYAVSPPVRPHQSLYDDIADAANKGLRGIGVLYELTEQNQWWLLDEGYTFVTVDHQLPDRLPYVVKICW